MLDEILNAICNSDDEFSGSGLTKRDNHLLDLYLALYQGALYERNLRRNFQPSYFRSGFCSDKDHPAKNFTRR